MTSVPIDLEQEIAKSQRPFAGLLEKMRAQGIDDEQTIQAMRQTPRQCFLPDALWHRAYENASLPILAKQTISQPYMVAQMTQLLIRHSPSQETVLEIGTGSGYQACVLSRIFQYVYTVERIASLHQEAANTLQQMNIKKVYCKLDDGQMGWSENGPYPAIIVTAALSRIPPQLIEQLAPDGVLIAPVGNADEQQVLTLVRHTETGIEQEEIEPVRFVPILSGTTI